MIHPEFLAICPKKTLNDYLWDCISKEIRISRLQKSFTLIDRDAGVISNWSFWWKERLCFLDYQYYRGIRVVQSLGKDSGGLSIRKGRYLVKGVFTLRYQDIKSQNLCQTLIIPRPTSNESKRNSILLQVYSSQSKRFHYIIVSFQLPCLPILLIYTFKLCGLENLS